MVDRLLAWKAAACCRFGLRRRVAAFKARTCPRNPNRFFTFQDQKNFERKNIQERFVFRASEGVMPMNFLKAELKAEAELNPTSRPMARMVK